VPLPLPLPLLLPLPLSLSLIRNLILPSSSTIRFPIFVFEFGSRSSLLNSSHFLFSHLIIRFSSSFPSFDVFIKYPLRSLSFIEHSVFSSLFVQVINSPLPPTKYSGLPSSGWLSMDVHLTLRSSSITEQYINLLGSPPSIYADVSLTSSNLHSTVPSSFPSQCTIPFSLPSG